MRSDSAVARRAITTYGQGRVGATVQHREMSESTIGKSRAEVHIGQLYITSSEYHSRGRVRRLPGAEPIGSPPASHDRPTVERPS
jgi:hypothetical protein